MSSRRGVYASSECGTLTIRSRARGIKVSERTLRLHFGRSARQAAALSRALKLNNSLPRARNFQYAVHAAAPRAHRSIYLTAIFAIHHVA